MDKARPYRKTKIVATLGPSTRSIERVKALIQAGVNVFRLNFSHGAHEEHTAALKVIRSAAAELKTPTAVLQDLSGPKIRISNVTGDFVTLKDGEEIELRYSSSSLSDEQTIFVEGLNPSKVLEEGQPVLLADGMIMLKAEKIRSDSVQCSIVKGGRVRSRVGIAFPDSAIDLPATTEKDLHDLKWGIEHQVDYVAISFVKNARDVLMLREAVKAEGGSIRIIAKIERKRALENVSEIVEVSDGLMVARGDLGLEVPLEQLPILQKNLIERANQAGIPVIVATQMLHSMITSVRPTRAEVSDIALAVMSGTDAVMLSDETAIGENPIESVEYLSRIAHEAEQTFAFEEYKLRLRGADRQTVPDAVAYAACAAAIKVDAAAIIACTETGNSARLVAKYRPQQPLYAASAREDTLRRMALNWGIIPILIASTETHYDEIDAALAAVQREHKLRNGERAVMIGGISVNTPGATNVLGIREIVNGQ